MVTWKSKLTFNNNKNASSEPVPRRRKPDHCILFIASWNTLASRPVRKRWEKWGFLMSRCLLRNSDGMDFLPEGVNYSISKFDWFQSGLKPPKYALKELTASNPLRKPLQGIHWPYTVILLNDVFNPTKHLRKLSLHTMHLLCEGLERRRQFSSFPVVLRKEPLLCFWYIQGWQNVWNVWITLQLLASHNGTVAFECFGHLGSHDPDNFLSMICLYIFVNMQTYSDSL